ncbi:MAG: amino acid permease [Eggerthella sp.]|nr:amino acid permease [Eggerthella sp.]
MSNAASETLDGSLAASAGASRDKGQIIDPNGLDLFRLTMMVITASICGGIFALAGDMAAGGASTGAVLISWAICFVGVFSLMMCFNGLSQARPDLTGGIYAYAAAGFGDFVGFNSAWGYWVSACLSNVSFAILLFSALGYFFHPFESGNNLLSCVCAAFATANPDALLDATVAAVAGMGLAGQIAQGRMSGYDGNGSFRTYLLDALYNLDGDALEAGARVEELA